MDAKLQNSSWDDLRVLFALYKAGTLKGAGVLLDINASTVGRRIDALEAALGVRLFDRTPDGARPTAAAEQLVPYAEKMELAAAGLANAIAGFESEPEGLVRISAPPGVADDFVAPLVVGMHTLYPRIQLELDSTRDQASLVRREADITLRTSRPEGGDLVAVRLVVMPSTIVASEELAAKTEPLSHLGAVPWISWTHDADQLPTAEWISANVPPEAVALRSSSLSCQVAAVESGLGATLLWRPYLTRPGLRELRLSPELASALAPMPTEELWLAGHRALRNVPRVAAIWTYLTAAYASSPGPSQPRQSPRRLTVH